ncbi:MAG: site-specific integrase, partial [Clostridia bacterium]|nr:site-specific integrase [Deltaproteobacteria bacterium]
MDDLECSAERYFDMLRVERNLSGHTVEAYARDLAGLRKILVGEGVTAAADVKPVHVKRWLRSLAETGKAASSQGRALSAVRQLFAFLVRDGRVTTNPATEIVGPRRRRPLPVVPSRQEMVRIIEAPAINARSASRDRAALELLYAAGLR